MTNNLFGTVSLLSLCLPGYLFSRLLLGNSRLAENIALSFPLGVQIFTLFVFVLNFIFGVQLTQFAGWVSVVFLTLFLFLLNIAKTPQKTKFSLKPTHLSIAILITLFILFLSAFTSSHWFPITDWDAVTLYDFRAKVILRTGWIADTLFRARFTDYPLLTTLAHWWMRVNGSFTPLPIYQMFLWTFSAAVFSALSKNFSRRTTIFATLFIVLCPKLLEQSFVAYSNLPYTIYLILGLIYFDIWFRERSFGNLLMALTLTTMSFWARTFPFAAGSILAMLYIFRPTRKLFYSLVTGGLILFLIKTWPFNIQLFWSSLDFLKWSVLSYYSPYPLMFVLIAVYQLRNKIKNNYLLVATTAFWILIVLGNYYYALSDPNFASIPDAAERTTMFINPAISLLIISVLHEKETSIS
jgi:hypothetical protein